MVDYIEVDGVQYAILIRNEYRMPGIQFFTPNEYSQQLACMSHPAGKTIEPHTHNEIERSVVRTQEVLLIKKGVVRVDFYRDSDRQLVAQRELYPGDVILLATGGHGFEMLEDAEIVEIKQGPYLGEDDKVRFTPTPTPPA